MNTRMIANILRLRRALRHRETWPLERLREHQQRELAALRHFAEESRRSTAGSTAAWRARRCTTCRC